MAIYVVDSNFFIDAHRRTYPLDIATSFWKRVEQLANDGKIISIDKVKEELYNKNDALELWCKDHLPNDFFKNSDNVINEYGDVMAWANSKSTHYSTNALKEFMQADEADAFVIAYALNDLSNRTIVTLETREPNRKSKVKIPDCCDALGVSCLSTIEMFRQLGATF